MSEKSPAGTSVVITIGPRTLAGQVLAVNETVMIVRDSPDTTIILRRDPSCANRTWTFQNTPAAVRTAQPQLVRKPKSATFGQQLARVYRKAMKGATR